MDTNHDHTEVFKWQEGFWQKMKKARRRKSSSPTEVVTPRPQPEKFSKLASLIEVSWSYMLINRSITLALSARYDLFGDGVCRLRSQVSDASYTHIIIIITIIIIIYTSLSLSLSISLSMYIYIYIYTHAHSIV